MTNKSLKEIREIRSWATPGKWEQDRYKIVSQIAADEDRVAEIDRGLKLGVGWTMIEASCTDCKKNPNDEGHTVFFHIASNRLMQDSKFIAAAPEIIDQLLKEREELRERIQSLKVSERKPTIGDWQVESIVEGEVVNTTLDEVLKLLEE